MPDYTMLLDGVCLLIGTLLTVSGTWGVVDPLFFGRYFGIPTATRENIVFYPGIGGRNLSAGLAVWAMTLAGEKRALGMFLLCWMCTGLVDTKIVYQHPQGTKVGVHMRNVGLLLVVGTTLLVW